MVYHYSPPATSPIISCAFPLWANTELYILVPLLTNLLFYEVSPFISPFLWQKSGKICQYGCYNFEILYAAFLDTIIKIHKEPNFLYVGQSVSWLTFLLKLDKYRNIFSV